VTATQCKHFDVLYLPKERNRQSRERREGDGSRDPDPSVSAVMDEMHIDFFLLEWRETGWSRCVLVLTVALACVCASASMCVYVSV